MRRRIFNTVIILLTGLFNVSAQQNTALKGFVIRGHVEGIGNGEKIFLYDINEQSYIDSAEVVNGDFILKGRVQSPVTCWIRYKDEYAIVQVENTKMEFKSPLKDMRLYSVSKGGAEQTLQNQLSALQQPYEIIYYGAYDSLNKKQYLDQDHKKRLLQTLNDYQDSAHNIYIAFGKLHPNSYIGLDILYRNRQRIGKDTVENLLVQMDETLRATLKAQALVLFVYGELAQKGKHFIDFKAVAINGIPFIFSSLKGNYILLNFWNASCGPCRRENKKISQDYDRFKNRLTIVSFSTDKNKNSWRKASKEDNILWANVSDLKGDNGKIKTQYNVQAIPVSFLINKEGIIVEKFIGLDDDFLNQLDKLISDK